MAFLLLAIGLAALLIGGTILVRGASGIASAFNVPTMIIGLTVVAFGTSMPELVVNVTGAVRGETDIAFGNVVGSNLANFGLVLGIAAIMSPIYLEGQVVRREVPFLLLITGILMVMAWDEPLTGSAPLIDRSDAIILFLLFTVFIYFVVRDVVVETGDPVFAEAEHFPAAPRSQGIALNSALAVAGMVLLVVGGSMTIEQGSTIARMLEIPEVVVGIFIVAVGTSLPELVTSAIAAYKKETDLALGNIVGSNIFNSLVVLPAAGIIVPIPIPAGGDLDLAVGFALVLVVIPLFFFSRARLGRGAGAALVAVYFAYMFYRVAA
jgi:cation:H+ antiporter